MSADIWINGQTEVIRFDDAFRHNAERLAISRHKALDRPLRWHTGISRGSVVGELKAVDDIADERRFMIVPPSGAETVTCEFPPSMRDEIHNYLFKIVRVRGRLHYDASSPFPYLVEADAEGGITIMPSRRKSMLQMRGAFAGLEKPDVEWDTLLNG